MTAPDNVIPGSASSDGRESIRFEKHLQNGVVLVVEKEQKNSPDDMDTITMWATLSSRGADARSNERPLHTRLNLQMLRTEQKPQEQMQ